MLQSIPRIKMCGFTRGEDIAQALQLGVDALGLVFYPPSKRALTIEQAAKLAAEVPPFAHLVGLFVDAEKSQVDATLRAVPLSLLQFHGNETAAYCESFGRPYIKVVRLPAVIDNEQHRKNVQEKLNEILLEHSRAKGFLLDVDLASSPGGTGHKFDWQVLPEKFNRPVVLAGGLNSENVAQAINTVKPYAVDVSSGIESSPGIKEHKKMADFVAQVNNA